jgi:hypothetical protein
MTRQKNREDKMKLKNIGYAALIAVAAAAFVIGSGGPSEAKAKRAAAPIYPGPCLTAEKPVCAAKGGMKFTYASACIAVKDGAKVVSGKACPAKKAMKHKKHKKKAKASKKKPMKK